MILVRPSQSFFKKPFFQRKPLLRMFVRLFFMGVFPLILGVWGYYIAFLIDNSASINASRLISLIYIPFFGIPFFIGILFYMWLDKD